MLSNFSTSSKEIWQQKQLHILSRPTFRHSNFCWSLWPKCTVAKIFCSCSLQVFPRCWNDRCPFLFGPASWHCELLTIAETPNYPGIKMYNQNEFMQILYWPGTVGVFKWSFCRIVRSIPMISDGQGWEHCGPHALQFRLRFVGTFKGGSCKLSCIAIHAIASKLEQGLLVEDGCSRPRPRAPPPLVPWR